MLLPKLLASADWSVNHAKRRMATAERTSTGAYAVNAPEEVGDVHTLISRLQARAGVGQSVLLGFDFPIGLPRHYAKHLGLETFRASLPIFGKGVWSDFFELSDVPSWRQPFSPKDYRKKKSKADLIKALGGSKDRILRHCERQGKAESLFFTVGAKQVGRGAIVGWRDVVRPALDDVKIWPFDGPLNELVSESGVTIAEIYPGAAYAALGVDIGKPGKRKSEQDHRRKALAPLLKHWPLNDAILTHSARSQFAAGFASEDDFDAMVGVLSMLQVAFGLRSSGEPRDDRDVIDIEGWILGLQHSTTLS